MRWKVNNNVWKKVWWKTRWALLGALVLTLFCLGIAARLSAQLHTTYNKGFSRIITDRQDREIAILPTANGHYVRPANDVPAFFTRLLLQKVSHDFYTP